MKKINNTHGGARKGAGRPKTGVKTVELRFRVPEPMAAKLKAKIAYLIDVEKNKPG